MAHSKTTDFPIGKKVFARYCDEYSDTQINFIPVYVLEDENGIVIGTKNDMVGTLKGYYQMTELTGTKQLNAKNLTNVYTKKKE